MKHLHLLAALLWVPTATLASKKLDVSIPVGYSTTLTLPSPATGVTVANPSLVEVKISGRKVTFKGKENGVTTASIKTQSGKSNEVKIYVAIDRYALP